MTKKELTKEQQDGINKIAELLKDKPETADRLTEHLKELSGVEAIAESISITKLYKPAEVIKILSISRRQLYRLIEAKKIRTVKVGTYQKIIGQDLINYLKGTESVKANMFEVVFGDVKITVKTKQLKNVDIALSFLEKVAIQISETLEKEYFI